MQRLGGKGFLWGWTLFVAAGVTACGGEGIQVIVLADSTNPVIQASMQDGRRDCPDHNTVKIVGPGSDSALFTTLSVSQDITLVPEFHDCQRLLEGRAATYGPLVGVFASNTLGAGGTPTPLPPGSGVTTAAPGTTQAPAQGLTGRLPVAEVVNFDEVEYAPLGIKPNFNCLYMFRDDAAENGIAAFMVSVGRDEIACTKEYDVSMGGTPLLVVPYDPPPGLTWEDIPAVARWDWDPVTRRQYIGIRCDLQWCEVGPQDGFGSSPGHNYSFQTRREKRTFWVKGWYDEQQLAVRVGNGLKPLQSVGTVVPDSALGDYMDADFPTKSWVPAAKVAVRSHAQIYEKKLGLRPGAVMPKKMNRLEVCNGTWAECRSASGGSPAQPTVNCTVSTDTWWARMIPVQGETSYYCVFRTRHTHDLPGTARWRWTTKDETIWIRCAEGCCQVNSDDT